MLKEGDLIAERYELEALIGEGGMASVWRAEDRTLRRAIAIKLLYVRSHRDPRVMIDQFLREARIAASVQHRNVIHTVDFGVAQDNLPYMVMELLSGESLAARMERQPPLRIEEVVHIASLTLRGLSAVHEAGIVHRDLKPQNVFLHRDSDAVYPKILDFGISRSLGNDYERPSAISTQEGLIVGTPDYMAPEQARGEKDVDRRADIYSVGAIIYEGITGRLPFEANSIGELIAKIITTTPKSMKELRDDVPEAISDCVAQAMMPDREQRFVDAKGFRRALLNAAEKAFPEPRVTRVSDAPGAEWSLGSGLSIAAPEPTKTAVEIKPERAQPAASPSTWGDFEGLSGKPQHPVSQSLVTPTKPVQASLAAPVRVAQAAPGLPLPRVSSPRVSMPGRPSAAQVNAISRAAPVASDSSMLGDSPFDPLQSGTPLTLDLDYGPAGSGPLPAARTSRAGSTRSAGNARANMDTSGRQARARPERKSWPTAWWMLPLVLLFGFALLLFAPGLLTTAVPDLGSAVQLETHNPATAGSDRRMQREPRGDLAKLPPALRDAAF